MVAIQTKVPATEHPDRDGDDMSNSDPIWNNTFQTITSNNTIPLGGYGQVPSVQDLIKQQTLLQQQALQAQQYPGWIGPQQGLAGLGQAPPGQGYAINQYRSQVERLLPLYPKSGEVVSLWYDGEKWVKLSGSVTGWKEEKAPDVLSNFSLDEIAEASDIIDEIEHARVA